MSNDRLYLRKINLSLNYHQQIIHTIRFLYILILIYANTILTCVPLQATILLHSNFSMKNSSIKK